ncbi:MAG: hypothetical protein H6901_12175 [Rhodobacteraceae bacterium]|nr:hypothetical protein [Paracoccaceae bacterium]MCP5342963.1 hypothetical protein [Paracoccaceae bacterium]
MADAGQSALEAFLVEDVILTLANLRGSLSWFVQSELPGDPNRSGIWLERIDRQIESLEERARMVLGQLCTETGGAAQPMAGAGQFAHARADQAPRTARPQVASNPPVFRTQRIAGCQAGHDAAPAIALIPLGHP